MGVTVSYEFYTESYGGSLPEAAFRESLPAALRHVKWLVSGRSPSCKDRCAYKRAVCAAAEAFAEYGEGPAGGFAIGDYRSTQYEGREPDGCRVATLAAEEELCETTLLFSGVR